MKIGIFIFLLLFGHLLKSQEIIELKQQEMLNFLSTNEVETSVAFSHDQLTAFVSRHPGKWGASDNPPSKIYEYQKKEGKWILIGLAPFSSTDPEVKDSDVFISYDGKVAFFTSNRPYSGKMGDKDQDIWFSRRVDDQWTEPLPVQNVNGASYEASPVTDEKGNLYFSSIREGHQLGDIYVAKQNSGGMFDLPMPIEGDVNQNDSGEWNVLIDPLAEWMIFESSGREGALSPYGDLYISINREGIWSTPKPFKEVNTGGSELNVRYLPRTNQLVFISSQSFKNIDTNIFTIDASKIDSYRQLDH